MLCIIDAEQRVIAEFSADVGMMFTQRVYSYGDATRLMTVLRHVPRDLLRISVRYPLVSDNSFQFNNYPEEFMINLDMYAPKATHIEDVEPIDASTMYFAPAPEEVPNDGLLEYATIETVRDLLALKPRTVVLLRPDQETILRAVSDYAALFHIDPKALTGLPTATYSITFDEVTWSFDKVAYVPFINELATALDVQKQLDAQGTTQYSREKANYTKSNGEVKSLTQFTAPDESADEPDSSFDELAL